MRRWLFAVFVSCAAAVAQPTPTDVFDKAPPEIDNALRERIATFYQAHVEGKFRQAEAVVAEDSKDYFYNLEKQRYLEFKIAKITYSDNFTKATVITAVQLEWRSPRLGVVKVTPPMTSIWKQENGAWFWYVIPRKDWDSPWGLMKPGPDPQPGARAAVRELPKGVDVITVIKQVTIDKSEMRLSSYQASQGEATITNAMPGGITLRLEPPHLPNLDVRLDKTELASGEVAKISISYKPQTPEPKPFQEIRVHVEPTGQILPVKLVFDIQPELKKLLPKELQK